MPPDEATRRLSRRRFLAAGAGGGAALALGLPLGLRGAGQAASRGHVVVVGAGLAGLTAAYELEQAGWKVTVLEARRRLGGRVKTIRGFARRQHAEAGGEYIDTGHRRLRGYARRFGLPLEDVRQGPGGDALVVRRGRRQREDDVYTEAVSTDVDRFYGRVDDLAAPLDPARPELRGAALDRRTAADLIEELDIRGTARFLIEADIRDDYTVEPSDLSLLYLAAATKVAEGQPDAGLEAFRVRGGNDRLVRAFARRLDGAIVRSSPVSAIEQSADGVRVRSRRRTVAADYCVLTAPLPALRAVRFSPALTPTLRTAIEELQYGAVTKTLLQYRRRAWRRRGLTGDAQTDLPLGSTWDATDRQRGRRGILVAYAAGERGVAAARLTDRARARAAARGLRRVFGGLGGLLGRTHSVAWANSPLTGGSYTAYGPGQMTRFRRALRTPDGRIHLAGEHTDAFTGYMEGAVRSGRRVAREIGRRG